MNPKIKCEFLEFGNVSTGRWNVGPQRLVTSSRLVGPPAVPFYCLPPRMSPFCIRFVLSLVRCWRENPTFPFLEMHPWQIHLQG